MNLMGLELCIYACVMCIHPEHKVHEHKYTHAVDSIYKRMKGSEIIYAAFTSIKMVKKDKALFGLCLTNISKFISQFL